MKRISHLLFSLARRTPARPLCHALWLLCLASLLWACSDDGATAPSTAGCETVSCKVAVVMPRSLHPGLKPLAAWSRITLQHAQEGLPRQLKLELEWIDEDSVGWEDRVRQLAADSTCRAIVGPYYSVHATTAALACAATDKTLVLPTVTSAEVQRAFAGKGFMWCLSEPDIAQCELMLTNAQLHGAQGVYQIVHTGVYGQTFLDWVGYQATELGLKLYRTWTYSSPEELPAILSELEEEVLLHNAEDPFQALLFIPDGADDMEAMEAYQAESVLPYVLRTLCADVACSDEVAARLQSSSTPYEGYTLSASPMSGFNEAYKNYFGCYPKGGEAQFYDALLLTFYGLCYSDVHGTPLNESLCRVVDARGTAYSWLEDDVALAIRALRSGTVPNVDGASGPLEFDAKKYTSVLHSVFQRWKLNEGAYSYVGYESTDGSLRTSNTSVIWDWAKSFQQFDEGLRVDYPERDDCWALIVATSTSWNNYRHQADAFAMYQTLRRQGMDDDHILLIVSDGYAYNNQNIWPGEIRVRSGGENVYAPAAIDYRLEDLEPTDLQALLSGQTSERLPKAIRPKATDNVFVFWSGHGNYGSLPWGERGKSLQASQMRDMLSALQAGGHYRQLFLAIEACYSGSIGEACEGIPGLLVMTAANSDEPSWAEQKNADMHIYLSNTFTRTFEESVDEQPGITLRELYYNLARTTSGSHVMVYNEANFGNLYQTRMTDFLP